MAQTSAQKPHHGFFILLLLIVVALGWWWFHPKSPAPTPTKSSQPPHAVQTKTSPTTIRLQAVGDMLPHETVNETARTSTGYDYLPMFQRVAPYLKAGDVRFCNQESPSDPNRAVSGYPTFNAPVSFASDLTQVGCNLINLANNHADDRGQAGIDATLNVWSKLPSLAVAGTASSAAAQQHVAYFTVKGVKFAFLSYAQCSNNRGVSSYGLNIFSKSLASTQLADARQHADMIIAAMHSCDENRSTQDSWQEQTAQYFADQGVNIVIGTGPHWLQPVTQLNRAGGGKTVVWYSLGNFLSSQIGSNALIGGIAVMDIDAQTHQVTKLGFMPTYMHYEWTAAQKASNDLLARHNLMLYPLDQATTAMADSQLDTTVPAQTKRVTQLMNRYTTVDMLTSSTFADF